VDEPEKDEIGPADLATVYGLLGIIADKELMARQPADRDRRRRQGPELLA
jgi:hypothetical protein